MKLSIKRCAAIIIVLLVIIVGLMIHHQHTHFNQGVTVNGVQVGGLTTKQAFQKVQAAKRPNKIYINGQLIFAGKPSSSGITNDQEQDMVKLQKQQRTIFPHQQKRQLILTPKENSSERQAAMQTATANAINQMNQGRQRPVDAYAVLKDNKVSIVPAKAGNMYDPSKSMKQFNQQAARGTIHISAHHMHPLSANSKTVQKEKAKLQHLQQDHITYQVSGQKHRLTSADIITKATYQHGKYSFDLTQLSKTIAKINKQQATLGRAFKFKTHNGQTITTNTKGTYGWKISQAKAKQSFTQALTNGDRNVNAVHDIYGKGYYTSGTGYGKTANDGIGKTYAEISIADQHAWFYRNGKCVFDADIVTGSNKPGDKTPLGVWYIMYQQSPSVLKGSNDDGSKYSSKVKYWSQFTDSGCGFHDAPWRTDWSKTAYLKTNSVTRGGSHGCANMKPADAPKAYKALSVHEPVIVY